jgi:RNA polymerase sigma-70 factor, ECF subfamily
MSSNQFALAIGKQGSPRKVRRKSLHSGHCSLPGTLDARAARRVIVNVDTNELTALLRAMRTGEQGAESRIVALIYPELRRLAQNFMRHERTDHTLQGTAMVHEVYLRLRKELAEVNDRAHLFAIFARQMRNFLVDYARMRQSEKRGASQIRISIDDLCTIGVEQDPDLVALNLAMDELETRYPRAGRVVELRFFGGLTWEELATVTGTSITTVKRDWDFARAWLFRHISASPRRLGSKRKGALSS